jgi:outer membrane receptor for ferrienterochelin and colicins
VSRFGFTTTTAVVTVVAGGVVSLTARLEPRAEVEEEVVVTSTRTNTRVQDSPIRIETLDREEIEEKLLMTPGDISMLLNETGGLRVQVTSPALGATNVRVQGLGGRYTQVLADGLPLYGGQAGSLGLLQIPPMDLGQVEVLKGVASAFYGPSALGGVVNLVARKPPPEGHQREVLLNQTTREGTDAVLWLAEPVSETWGYTFLGGFHRQSENDIDGDSWADMAGYRRGVARPRVYWDNHAGQSFFLTAGVMVEEREGGTLEGGEVPTGGPYVEALDTTRFDTGLSGRFLIRQSVVLGVRGAVMTQEHTHRFGPTRERDRHGTGFGELSVSGTRGSHTWVLGAALQADTYRARDVDGFDYTFVVPAVFAQDDVALNPRMVLSGSARLDWHSEYGWFVNPRISALVRPGRGWTTRLSYGTGYFAPTPFTDETEPIGLSRVEPITGLGAERGQSASLDAGRSFGPVEINATVFASEISNPVQVVPAGTDPAGADRVQLINVDESTRTVGTDLLARVRWQSLAVTGTYTFIHSTELDAREGVRAEVPLTPRHGAGLVASWEQEGRGRVGVEWFYTGRQRLDDNPFRTRSTPYAYMGILGERRIGRVRLFVNAENLTDVRQTKYDPLVRPTPGLGGRWTVDAWAPLDGRTINGGVRVEF